MSHCLRIFLVIFCLLQRYSEGLSMDLKKNVGPSYSRRLSIVSIGRALSIPFAVATLSPQPSLAEVVPGTTFISGRQPKVPGAKKRDPNDTKGTKKDPNFLRSVSDCKSKCDNTRGPDGLAKSKEDCLSECQDICCTSYEQCTFAIVPRI